MNYTLLNLVTWASSNLVAPMRSSSLAMNLQKGKLTLMTSSSSSSSTSSSR